MSLKSIIYSIISVLFFGAVIVGIVFLFKFSIIAGIAGIVLLIFPAMLQRKALHEAEGIIDKFIAKFVVPVLFVVLGFLSIMAIGFWITL